jgi:Pyruvate/2-oxoacid:ferredoxin oxidoreductase delta subunit
MKRALIHPEICVNCQPCQVEAKCPMQAVIREQKAEKPWVDFYRCSGCLKCKDFCPNQAIEEISHPCDGKRRIGW